MEFLLGRITTSYYLWSTSRPQTCPFATRTRSSRMEDLVRCSRMRARKRRGGAFCARVAIFRVLPTTALLFQRDGYILREIRTIGFEKGGMAIGPCTIFGQGVPQEYLYERKYLVVSYSDDRIKAVQCIKVKDSRYAQGSNDRIDSSRTGFGRGGWECVYK